ncbi:MAG: helix-turn-helix domain-containing protein [Thermoactinomyces sp.]
MPRSSQKEGMTSRDLQAAKRRKQLLEAAKKLFAEKGYHNTSTKEINRAIGMADGLIYHYFP